MSKGVMAYGIWVMAGMNLESSPPANSRSCRVLVSSRGRAAGGASGSGSGVVRASAVSGGGEVE